MVGEEEESLTTTVQSHSSRACEIMVSNSFLFHKLLRHGVTGCKENRRGDTLGEYWARGQLPLVPISELELEFLRDFERNWFGIIRTYQRNILAVFGILSKLVVRGCMSTHRATARRNISAPK